jgi:hypothetical protein
MTSDPLIKQIEDRLPELAWKTSLLPHRMNLSTLPKSLFSLSVENHPSDCVHEIKRDLRRLHGLANHSQEYRYLAKRVQQKIEVLVRLCQIQLQKQSKKTVSAQLMMRLCHRKQWIVEIEKDIEELKEQYTHLQSQWKACNDTQIKLTMQADLGMLEKKITLLQEKIQRTV